MVIDWVTPDFLSEADEYFHNEYAREYFADRGISFTTEQEFLDWILQGSPKEIQVGYPLENLDYNPDKLLEFYGPRYVESYRDMERRGLAQGTLTLPMPIAVAFDDGTFSLAGNRRTNLAWKYVGSAVMWIVKKSAKSKR